MGPLTLIQGSIPVREGCTHNFKNIFKSDSVFNNVLLKAQKVLGLGGRYSHHCEKLKTFPARNNWHFPTSYNYYKLSLPI